MENDDTDKYEYCRFLTLEIPGFKVRSAEDYELLMRTMASVLLQYDNVYPEDKIFPVYRV